MTDCCSTGDRERNAPGSSSSSCGRRPKPNRRISLASTLAAGSYVLLILAVLSREVSASEGTTATNTNNKRERRTSENNSKKPWVSTVRNFYITTELVEWDYAPSGDDLIEGVPLSDNEDAVVFIENTPSLIGQKYIKSLYKQYTDDTYTKEIEAPEWAGNLGPIIRAEVGDTILVHFKNMLPDLPASMHPHGVLYTPENEGAFWRLNTFPGSAVAPGDSFVYEWTAREDSGPTGDDKSNLWRERGCHDCNHGSYSQH